MGYQPNFTITPLLLGQVESIAVLRERIRSAVIDVAWVPALQKDSRARNAHSSTAIEGNPLTLEQVKAVEDGREIPEAMERSKREILNYFAGLRFIEKNAHKKTIRQDDILELHHIVAARVMDQGQAGAYRTMRVRVGPYFPPPPHEVSGLMFELLEWWNKESIKLSPVLSSAILHYRFESIHPFADGNGRTGRALALWELYRRGFDTHHIFSVDEFYWEDRSRYYQALQKIQLHEKDMTSWLEYSAEGLEFTLKRVWERIQKFMIQVAGKKIILRPKQERLMQLLRDQGSLTPSEIRKALGVSRQGAMDLINPLLQAELVMREGTYKFGSYRLKNTI